MKSLLKKKNVLIALLAVLLIGTGVAATLAYLSSETPTLTNTFTVGNVTTKIEEEFKPVDYDLYDKNPKVRNTGENDCYVRVRVVCSPEGAVEPVDFNSVNWYDRGDGYYYYVGTEDNKGVLKASTREGELGASTEPLFTQIKVIDTSIDGFEVTVYQEAVQTIFYRQNGDPEPITDMYAIWDEYDKESHRYAASDSDNS